MGVQLIEQGITEQEKSWEWDVLVRIVTADDYMMWIELHIFIAR